MPDQHRYEIELRGRATDRVLRPIVDDFSIEHTTRGTTRLVGVIRDPSHLNGVLAHFTSLNVDVVLVRQIDHPTEHHTHHQEGPAT